MAKSATATAAAPKSGAPLVDIKSGTPPGASGSGKRKKLLILLAAVVLAGGGGGAAWYFLGHNAAASPEGAAKPSSRPPLFLTLDQFTVNFAEESGDHYLQVGIVYQVSDTGVADSLKVYMPVLRNRILMLLAAKKPSEVATSEGKRKLVDELVSAARESIPGSPGDKGILTAMFSSFVVQ